jgi:hypothetical protein
VNAASARDGSDAGSTLSIRSADDATRLLLALPGADMSQLWMSPVVAADRNGAGVLREMARRDAARAVSTPSPALVGDGSVQRAASKLRERLSKSPSPSPHSKSWFRRDSSKQRSSSRQRDGRDV